MSHRDANLLQGIRSAILPTFQAAELTGIAVSHTLARMSRFCKTFMDFDPDLLLLSAALEVYLIPRLLTKDIVPPFAQFFIEMFLNFPIGERIEGDRYQAFRFLNEIIGATVVMPSLAFDIDFEQIGGKLMQMISTPNIPVRCRNELFGFLVKLCARIETVSRMVLEPRMADLIARYFSDVLLDMSPTSLPQPPSFTADDDSPLNRTVQSFIPRTFSYDFPALPGDEVVFPAVPLMAAEVPESVSQMIGLKNIVRTAEEFCSFVRIYTGQSPFPRILRGLLHDPAATRASLFPFFLVMAASREAALGMSPQTFHELRFYISLLESLVVESSDAGMRRFCSDFFLSMCWMFPSELGFMIELQEFFLTSIRRLCVHPTLSDCLRICASVGMRPFMVAAEKIKFVQRLSQQLLDLQFLHHTEPTEELVETRRLVLGFVDMLRSDPNLFRCFFNKLVFANCVMSLFYDQSTARLAQALVGTVLQYLTAHSPTMPFKQVGPQETDLRPVGGFSFDEIVCFAFGGSSSLSRAHIPRHRLSQ
jgi:hypothetical protein